MFSATTFALSLDVLPRNRRQCHRGCLSLHTIQFSCPRLGFVPVPFEDELVVAEAKNFASVCFHGITNCARSSFLGFMAETFILSCASTLSFNHSLKSKRVSWLHFYLTVCVDQASFLFGKRSVLLVLKVPHLTSRVHF